MTVDILTSIEIERPGIAVSEFAPHPSNVPEWYANIQLVERLAEPLNAELFSDKCRNGIPDG